MMQSDAQHSVIREALRPHNEAEASGCTCELTLHPHPHPHTHTHTHTHTTTHHKTTLNLKHLITQYLRGTKNLTITLKKKHSGLCSQIDISASATRGSVGAVVVAAGIVRRPNYDLSCSESPPAVLGRPHNLPSPRPVCEHLTEGMV